MEDCQELFDGVYIAMIRDLTRVFCVGRCVPMRRYATQRDATRRVTSRRSLRPPGREPLKR